MFPFPNHLGISSQYAQKSHPLAIHRVCPEQCKMPRDKRRRKKQKPSLISHGLVFAPLSAPVGILCWPLSQLADQVFGVVIDKLPNRFRGVLARSEIGFGEHKPSLLFIQIQFISQQTE
jgi:hypothetical protein